MNKKFKLSVKIKKCKLVFKKKLGEGVIASQELLYENLPDDICKELLAQSLLEEKEKLLKKIIEVNIEEIE